MSLSSKLAYRGLVTVLSVVTVVAQVLLMRGGGGTLAEVRPASLPVLGMGALDSVVAALLALALVWGTRGGKGAYALAVCLAAWGYVLAYSGVVGLFTPVAQELGRRLFDAHFPLVEALGLAGALRFSAVFPSVVRADDVESPDSLPIGLRTLQRVRRALLGPSAPWIAAGLVFVLLLAVNRMSGGLLQEAPLNPLATVIRFAAFTAVVLNLRISWVRARGRDRKRVSWAVVGLTFLIGFLGILIGGNVLLAVTEWRIPLVSWRPVVLDLGLLGLLWGTAMGVLYEGVIDPTAVGRRVAMLCGAATVALFLAAGLEALFSDVLVGRLIVPTGLGTVLAAVLTGLVYTRARATLEVPLNHIWSPEPATPLD